MGLGIVVVEVCDSNLLSSLELEQLEEEYPEIAVLRLDCLNLCGLCKLRPYAMVNGKRVFAKTVEECVQLIKQTIEEELRAFDNIDGLDDIDI
ncbi:DUF1450 domain-containing protein [Paenibacillus bouchesdurhonensis]|uniref:DUF1450 domain-containing protein n=1 Tax=Paenibacillus bouchesdurhonensis TaxID=1870990 RepID=UPI001901393F|nr:DUF1450 domain-containing protein [Paenibacillus bouchesdurhonensis]